MKSEEDKIRFEEARSCNDCLGWHKYCKAECCKLVFLNISLEHFNQHKNFVYVHKVLDRDKKRYYQLRGVVYMHGILKFPKEYCFYTGNKIIYARPCDLLDGFLCKEHPSKKPKFCQDLNLENLGKENNNFEVTDNCLFKYKEVIEDGEEKNKSEKREQE